LSQYHAAACLDKPGQLLVNLAGITDVIGCGVNRVDDQVIDTAHAR
jgi:hypothetical protein